MTPVWIFLSALASSATASEVKLPVENSIFKGPRIDSDRSYTHFQITYLNAKLGEKETKKILIEQLSAGQCSQILTFVLTNEGDYRPRTPKLDLRTQVISTCLGDCKNGSAPWNKSRNCQSITRDSKVFCDVELTTRITQNNPLFKSLKIAERALKKHLEKNTFTHRDLNECADLDLASKRSTFVSNDFLVERSKNIDKINKTLPTDPKQLYLPTNSGLKNPAGISR